MATKSERQPGEKPPFSVITLVGDFLRESGVTPEQIQAMRESPERMKEFASLAMRAKRDHDDRVTRLQLEREGAVDIDGVHYHVVVVPLMMANCTSDSPFGELLRYARSSGLIQLKPEAHEKARLVVASMSKPGLWLAGVEFSRNPHGWRQLGHEVVRVECGNQLTTATALSEFPPDLIGLLFLMDSTGCEFAQRR